MAKNEKKTRSKLPNTKEEKLDCLACEAIAKQDSNYEVKEATNHGLCGNHAQSATKAVNRIVEAQGITKDAAWQLLIDAGRARAATRRSSQDWFLQGIL